MILEIKKIVHGGYGLAFFEDKTVFVPYAAPGDRVECAPVRERKRVIFARIERIVEPATVRREPECPVFGVCGGCHLQHLGYEDELAVKKQAVLEDLSRIGKIETGVDRVIPSPSRYGYRNHAVFKVDEERRPGFLMRESESLVPFPPAGCLLLPEAMRAAIAALPPEAFEPLTEVRIRIDRYGNVHFWGLLDRVGPPEILMEGGSLLYPVSPDSFFQVNALLGGDLQQLVRSLPRAVPRKLLDLYCGVGFFTTALAGTAGEALGIERDQGAVRNAIAAARLNALPNVKFRRGDAAREIAKLRGFDLVLVDPPRFGVPKALLAGLLRLRPAEIIFVSCDPPTFARDAAALIEAGYVLYGLNLIDLFPATYHAEIVAIFRRG
jgi:23S rRNA (uracil1939-C5)-methyltransferase